MKPKISSTKTYSTRNDYEISCPEGWGDYQYHELVTAIDKKIELISYVVGKKNVGKAKFEKCI